jgi:hypothetical protein
MPYKRDVIQYFFYFATSSMKKKLNLKFKTVKVEVPPKVTSAVCRDTTVSVNIKKLNFTVFSIIIISRLFLLRYAKQYRNSISTNAK